MLQPISDDDRRSLVRLAGMLCCSSIALLAVMQHSPIAAGAQDGVLALRQRAPALPGELRFPTLRVMRDPFVSNQALAETPSRNAADPQIVLPPNAGASDLPVLTVASAPVVRAVILGESSRALIELGGDVHVFAVGDRIGSATISSIRSDGVTLSNAVRLPLVPQL
jgi:hypothetical protein